MNRMPFYQAPARHVSRVFIHCSASDDPTLDGDRLVEEITLWHINRGFSTVGYHFLIDKSGAVLAGRPLSKTPAAQRGHNSGTVAVMVHGLDDFTDASLQALRRFCQQINEAHRGRVSFHGHCEVSAKSCPVFDYRSWLDLDRFGRMP